MQENLNDEMNDEEIESLRDIEAFAKRLIQEHSQFLAKLSPSQRLKKILICGGKDYSCEDIKNELEALEDIKEKITLQDPPFAASYVRMMYDSFFQSDGLDAAIGGRPSPKLDELRT